jgi:hypothetical protein
VLHGFPVAPNLVDTPRKTWRRQGSLPNYYAILGVRPIADTAGIKAAYRLLVKQLHPDVSAASEAVEQGIRTVNEAYEVLVDPATRAEYDLEVRRRRAEAGIRFWRSFAVGVVACVLMVGSSLLVAPLILAPPTREVGANPQDQSESEARQKKRASVAPTAKVPAGRVHPEAIAGPLRVVPSDVVQPSGQGDVVAQREISPEHGAPERAAKMTPHDGRHASEDKRLPGLRQDNVPVAEPRPAAAAPERIARAAPQSAIWPEQGAEKPKPPNVALEPRLPERPSAAVAGPRPKAGNWTGYHSHRFGFALKYPANVFTGKTGESTSDNLLLASDVGRAILWISASPTRTGRSIAAYRNSLIAERFAGAAFDYAPERENWFVLSGTMGDEMFYERVTFSCDRQSVHHWLLVYPVAERAFFDAIVEDIHRSYRYDLNQFAHCAGRPMGLARPRALPVRGEDAMEAIPH